MTEDVLCLDCKMGWDHPDKHHHYYMVHDRIWLMSGLTPNGGKLCFKCLERRIGRRIDPFDLTKAPVNDDHILNWIVTGELYPGQNECFRKPATAPSRPGPRVVNDGTIDMLRS